MGRADPIRLEADVPPELAGERVDRAAAQLFDDYSRALLSRWIAEGTLTVDGDVVKPGRRLLGGERLSVEADLAPVEDWSSAQVVPFEVIHEDEDLLIVNKPAGVVVHPGAGNPDGTLVNGLIRHRPALAELPRAGIVHRLDKDTSGLLVVAASRPAHTHLIRALEARAIGRRYLAVTEGVMVSGADINAPIGRDPGNRTRQRVRPDGKPARTRIRVRERYRAHTWVEAELFTGRTHQIRVHLSEIGFPIVGDRRYGARGRLPRAATPELVERVQNFRRQALHAWRLLLDHPLSGEALHFEAPLPSDLAALKRALNSDAQKNASA